MSALGPAQLFVRLRSSPSACTEELRLPASLDYQVALVIGCLSHNATAVHCFPELRAKHARPSTPF
eukprot:10071225-Prorocentrum_lima.AAC.1